MVNTQDRLSETLPNPTAEDNLYLPQKTPLICTHWGLTAFVLDATPLRQVIL